MAKNESSPTSGRNRRPAATGELLPVLVVVMAVLGHAKRFPSWITRGVVAKRGRGRPPRTGRGSRRKRWHPQRLPMNHCEATR